MPIAIRLLALFVALQAGGLIAPASAWAGGNEAELKAAFIYNFAKFVDWPDAALSASGLNLCLPGPRDALFEAILAFHGKAIRERSINVRLVARGEPLKPCQILVLSDGDRDGLDSSLKRVDGAPVLTVLDQSRDTDTGSVISLVMEGSKVRFNVNLAAARRNNLNISANLLRLARQVKQ